MSAPSDTASPERWRALAFVAVGVLFSMSLWFSASAVAPALKAEWSMSEAAAWWLTLAVQFGFVAGTLVSALANLPDVFPARRIAFVSAVLGASANASVALLARGSASALVLRFLTGFCLAGVYPPGMKILASWFRRGRGTALGVLVGALTVGKAFPYLVNALAFREWRTQVLVVSAVGAVGGALILLVGDGPFAAPAARFDATQIAKVFRNRGVRLADFGYFGHMWELYAMWTWIPVFLRGSFAVRSEPARLAEAASFLVIGSGAVGCVAGGLLGDRVGRTAVTSWAMAISGACCLGIGFLYGAPPAVLLVFSAIWGAAVVADSAQFSACVTELSDPQYIGTALTVQTCVGFFLTTASIELVGVMQRAIGWNWAFAVLAPGPAFGVAAMLRLRGLPEAARIAHGKR